MGVQQKPYNKYTRTKCTPGLAQMANKKANRLHINKPTLQKHSNKSMGTTRVERKHKPTKTTYGCKNGHNAKTTTTL